MITHVLRVKWGMVAQQGTHDGFTVRNHKHIAVPWKSNVLDMQVVCAERCIPVTRTAKRARKHMKEQENECSLVLVQWDI